MDKVLEELGSHPLTLTVNGKPRWVLQDAASYQALLDQLPAQSALS
jgi:hypothetical protein